jgi:RNA polymerase sigma-70 factor (ECF subfamily)
MTAGVAFNIEQRSSYKKNNVIPRPLMPSIGKTGGKGRELSHTQEASTTMTIATYDTSNVPESNLMALLPHLRAFARSLVRNHDRADDLVHDTIVRALTAAHGFQPGTNLKGWMFTILRNQFYNDLRQNKPLLSLDIPMMAEPSIPAGQESHLELDDFRRAFWQLSDDKREVLILVGASGLSYDEAAKICGCAQGTIKSRVSRARLELRSILEKGSFANLRRDTPMLADWFGGLLNRMPTRSMAVESA